MDGITSEKCPECGFDATEWRLRDVSTVFDELGYWWRHATADVSPQDLNCRPAPGVWSALEYGLHTAMVTATIRRGVESVLAENGCVLPPVPAPPPDAAVVPLDASAVLDSLEREGAALAALAASRSAAWHNLGYLAGTPVQAEAAVVHATHDASHHFMDVAQGLAALGVGTPKQTGTVVQVNASDGGVPKTAIGGGRITRRGLEGDRQADRKHHGRPFQALCLWSADVIAELAASGHPVAAGCAGENVTLAGIQWSTMRPGTRMRLGSALIEVFDTAVPCANQAQWFLDGDYSRLSEDRFPCWVRWYAWVREEGDVHTGDVVTVQP
jgi:MOSC domain-containing protein YiiM